jgi:hypothetical protein
MSAKDGMGSDGKGRGVNVREMWSERDYMTGRV